MGSQSLIGVFGSGGGPGSEPRDSQVYVSTVPQKACSRLARTQGAPFPSLWIVLFFPLLLLLPKHLSTRNYKTKLGFLVLSNTVEPLKDSEQGICKQGMVVH